MEGACLVFNFTVSFELTLVNLNKKKYANITDVIIMAWKSKFQHPNL